MLKALPQLRQYQLLALMVFLLGAAQLVQASSLHDHGREGYGHSIDCALCHLPVADDPERHSHTLPNFDISGAPKGPLVTGCVAVQLPSPYQSRAPPRS